MINDIASEDGKIRRDFMNSGVHALFKTWRGAAIVVTERTGRRIIIIGFISKRVVSRWIEQNKSEQTVDELGGPRNYLQHIGLEQFAFDPVT